MLIHVRNMPGLLWAASVTLDGLLKRMVVVTASLQVCMSLSIVRGWGSPSK